MSLSTLIERMKFHGWLMVDGVFYKAYDSAMTIEQAQRWLASLEESR